MKLLKKKLKKPFKFYPKMMARLMGSILIFSLTFFGHNPEKKGLTKQQVLQLDPQMENIYIYNYLGSVGVEANFQEELTVIAERVALGNGVIRHADTAIHITAQKFPDGYLVYIESACTRVLSESRKVKYCCCSDEEPDVKFDLKVRVPADLNLVISTIYEGDINVSGINGRVGVSVVNGSISLTDVTGTVDAVTINGNIDAIFNTMISPGSSFETRNGNIYVSCPDDLSANIRFDAFNGSMYTDFKNVKPGKESIELSENAEDGRHVYAYRFFKTVDIGEGFARLNFETFNGNVYLKNNNY